MTNDKLADEIEHLYSLCSADWASLKRDFKEANRQNWIILCDQGLRNLEWLRRIAQEAVGEVLSQDLAMRELRDQRDRAMEAHVAALRAERPQSGEMVMVPRSFAHTLACRLETEAIIGDERSLARKLRDALAAAEAERGKAK